MAKTSGQVQAELRPDAITTTIDQVPFRPTGDVPSHTPDDAEEVEEATVKVLVQSFVCGRICEPGEVVGPYTGKLGTNLELVEG